MRIAPLLLVLAAAACGKPPAQTPTTPATATAAPPATVTAAAPDASAATAPAADAAAPTAAATEPAPDAATAATTATTEAPDVTVTPTAVEDAATPTPTIAASDAAASPTPTTPKGKPKKLDKAAREKGKDDFAKFRALLDDGRRAVKADDPEAGMKKLEAALKIVPGHPAALGELGWAAYRAGPAYFDKAIEVTRAAIAISKKDSQRGALWYNLGRVAEDRGQLDVALRAYRESLSFRPNDTVRERLEGLVAKVGGKTADAGLAALEDICADLRATEGCEVVVDAAGTPASPCSCTHDVLGPEPGFGRAALVRIQGTNEDAGGSLDSTYLAIEVAARWHVIGLVGNDWNPGFGYVQNVSLQKRFAFDTWGKDANAPKVLWVEFENTLYDRDPGVYEEHSDQDHTLTLCTVAGSAPACYELTVGAMSDLSKLEMDDGEALPEGVVVEEFHHEWDLTARLGDDGRLTLAIETGTPPDELKGMPGTWTWDQLQTAPGVRKLER